MARKKRKRIASRGSVNTTILKTLINGDKYGYEIIKEVEEFSEGKILLKQPSLYSSLSRFEEKGIVSSYWGDSDIGGRRHYYHLTDLGHKYYNEHVLKIKEEDEEANDISVKHKDDNQTLIPVSNDTIPNILNFDVKPEHEVIPDHNFNKPTPLINEATQTEQPALISKENDDDYKIIMKLASKVKSSNNRASTTPLKKLHFIKPKKSQKVILDSDGIFKLRDVDYVAKISNKKENIIDNVIKRTSHNTTYGYANYTETTPQTKEISDEEKRIRNQLFIEKFNNLTKSKLKIVEEKSQSKVEDNNIDYRSKLSSVVENSSKLQNIPQPAPTNNIYNYNDEDDEIRVQFQQSNVIEEDEEDKFIDFEPTEFDIKNDNSKYVEEINSVPPTNGITLNRYEHKSKPIVDDKNYVLINKAKLVFGLILGLILTTELLVSYLLFKNYDMIMANDNKLYIIMSIISSLLVLIYIIPYFVNKSQHVYNNFKLKYASLLGMLSFLVLIILIYCINALMGFEIDNFDYFAVKLILPAILAINFIIMPPIYSVIIKNKNFYD